MGLGCMGMSALYGLPDGAEAIATIHAALDAGIDLLETGDFYGMGHNEMLIREALAQAGARPGLRISVKFGEHARPDNNSLGRTAAPAAVPATSSRTRCGGSAWRAIDVYRPAPRGPAGARSRRPSAPSPTWCAKGLRPPRRPVGGRRRPRSAGPPAVTPISDLQIEYSLISPDIEDEILPACRELGMGITAYGVLSGASSAATGAPRPGAGGAATSGPTARASRARPCSTTWTWWTRSAGWRRAAAPPSRRSRSPG